MDPKATSVPTSATPDERQQYQQYLDDHKAYREYVTQTTRELGNALRANPNDENAYNAYKDGVKTYYEVQGGAKGDLIPDEKTVSNLIEGGKQFFGSQWDSIKQAAQSRNPFTAFNAIQLGAVTSIADLPVMALQGASWLGEKGLAEAGEYELAAERAAGRLRDTAKYEGVIQQYVRPEDQGNQGLFDVSRTVAGFAIPVGGVAKIGKTGAAATQAAKTAKTAGGLASGLETVGEVAGGVVGAMKGGIPGAVKGSYLGGRFGRVAGEAIETGARYGAGTAKGTALGGGAGAVLGGAMVGAQEPVGTPMSTGVLPGALLGAGGGAYLGARGALADGGAQAKGRGFADFDASEGGAIRVDQNRWAMETGPGVGWQSQTFKSPIAENLHRDTVGSFQHMQENPRYGVEDSVMRYGYDPETGTLQVVMSEATKGDAIPRDRYVYQNVSPELAKRIMDSVSVEAEINALAKEGGYNISMSRPKITDAQLNSLTNDINSGKLEFHPQWGFVKGSGKPPEFQFSSREPQGPTPSSPDLSSPDWNPGFFEEAMATAGRKAGEAYKGMRSAFTGMEEPVGTPVREGVVSGPEWQRMGGRTRESSEVAVREPARALATMEGRRPALAEPRETVARRQDVEAALAREEAELRSPQGAQALREKLAAEQQAADAAAREQAARVAAEEEAKIPQRQRDVEAALADEDARIAQEERLRQSQEGLTKLKGALGKRADDATRRANKRVLETLRKEAGIEWPPTAEQLERANIEATKPTKKEPSVSFEQAVRAPEGGTIQDAKRMSQRMREIDAELAGLLSGKTRVKLLEERLEIGAQLGDEQAKKALEKWSEPNAKADFLADVRKLVNEKGITSDPNYKNAGEVNLLRESGINFKKFSPKGTTLDKLGELIAEKATEYGLMTEGSAAWDLQSTMQFIEDAFSAPRAAEPPRIGEPPIAGKFVEPKQPKTRKPKAEGEAVTSVKDLQAQKKKAAIDKELGRKPTEQAEPVESQPTPEPEVQAAAPEPAPKPKSALAAGPKMNEYETAFYRLSDMGKVAPNVVAKIKEGYVTKGLLTADEAAGVKEYGQLLSLLENKSETASKPKKALKSFK